MTTRSAIEKIMMNIRVCIRIMRQIFGENVDITLSYWKEPISIGFLQAEYIWSAVSSYWPCKPRAQVCRAVAWAADCSEFLWNWATGSSLHEAWPPKLILALICRMPILLVNMWSRPCWAAFLEPSGYQNLVGCTWFFAAKSLEKSPAM